MQLDEHLSAQLQAYPPFSDRVDDPWQTFPDLESFNRKAYRLLEYEIRSVMHDEYRQSRGCLILGAAGTGKTHILMRVVRQMSQENHVMFVRRITNVDTVSQYIWTSIIQSLVKPLPGENEEGLTQLGVFLTHIFVEIMYSEVQRKVQAGKVSGATYLQFLERIKSEPFKTPQLLKNPQFRYTLWNIIRNKLKREQPEIDLALVSALFKFFYLTDRNRRRKLRRWLEGQLDDEATLESLGLEPWIRLEGEGDYLAMKEQKAETAIHTLSLLSLYYQHPLVLCFDQMEGLKGEPVLLKRYTDVIREIFTRCQNFLVITCIFPEMWDEITAVAEQSYVDRAGQSKIHLDDLDLPTAKQIIQLRLQWAHDRAQVPPKGPLYPFEEQDVPQLLYRPGTTPRAPFPIRQFLARCRESWKWWILGEIPAELQDASAQGATRAPGESEPGGSGPGDSGVAAGTAAADHQLNRAVTPAEIREVLARVHEELVETEIPRLIQGTPNEENLLTAVVQVLRTLVAKRDVPLTLSKLKTRKVFPLNVLLSGPGAGDFLVGVINKTGNSFTARMKNLVEQHATGTFHAGLLVRDARVPAFPESGKGREYLDQLAGVCPGVRLEVDELAHFLGLYALFEDVRNQEVQIRNRGVTLDDAVAWVVDEEIFREDVLLARLAVTNVGRVLFAEEPVQPSPPEDSPAPGGESGPEPGPESGPESVIGSGPKATGARAPESTGSPRAAPRPSQLILGTTAPTSRRLGYLGEIKDEREDRPVLLSLEEPKNLQLFGFMGSGKSYALGTIIENAVLPEPYCLHQEKPLAVVAFNYRRDFEARLEYPSYARPNPVAAETRKLKERYGLDPVGIQPVNFVTYEEELTNRPAEYGANAVFPLVFLPEELGAESWQLLMKPPSTKTEYVAVLKKILKELYYAKNLTLEAIRHQVDQSALTQAQKRLAGTRLDFASQYIRAARDFSWEDVLQPGALSVFDLRGPMIDEYNALILVLVILRVIRNSAKDVNKLVVFDEAHEYMNQKQVQRELMSVLSQIRHDGISCVLATQFPDNIPQPIFKYFDTSFLFKITNKRSFHYLKQQIPNMENMTAGAVSRLPKGKGYCYVLTEGEVNDPALYANPLFQFRPRMTAHGGATITGTETPAPRAPPLSEAPPAPATPASPPAPGTPGGPDPETPEAPETPEHLEHLEKPEKPENPDAPQTS